MVVLGALAKVLLDWLGGNLAGVHINVAERLSLVRKGLIVALCRLLGVPTVLHLHAAQLPQNFGGMSALSRRLTCRMFALATLVVVLGEGARRFVVETLGVPADRVHVIANGVPGPAALPGARAVSGARALSAADAVAPPGLRLLFVGNLSERKGVTDLLESVAALRRSRPDLALDLHQIAVARVGQARQARLVLVAQRQVQRQVDVAHQPEPGHRALRAGQRLRVAVGHGAHCLTGRCR